MSGCNIPTAYDDPSVNFKKGQFGFTQVTGSGSVSRACFGYRVISGPVSFTADVASEVATGSDTSITVTDGDSVGLFDDFPLKNIVQTAGDIIWYWA
jgi:hypothetical protein